MSTKISPIGTVRGHKLKRPAFATKELAVQLIEQGYSYHQIGKMWGVSGARVHQVAHQK
ncbi:MAG: hypothetical protein U1D67_05335 [Dehalococcoidia bacterium]|nr:hypothetical protein [Dehalococcoidia bacterium]